MIVKMGLTNCKHFNAAQEPISKNKKIKPSLAKKVSTQKTTESCKISEVEIWVPTAQMKVRFWLTQNSEVQATSTPNWLTNTQLRWTKLKIKLPSKELKAGSKLTIIRVQSLKIWLLSETHINLPVQVIRSRKSGKTPTTMMLMTASKMVDLNQLVLDSRQIKY